MATNFIDCESNSIPFQQLLRSLFNLRTSNDLVYFRVNILNPRSISEALVCNTSDEFERLFKRALSLGTDGKATLNIVLTTFKNGVGLEGLNECGDWKENEKIATMGFVLTFEGDVAFNLASIT